MPSVCVCECVCLCVCVCECMFECEYVFVHVNHSLLDVLYVMPIELTFYLFCIFVKSTMRESHRKSLKSQLNTGFTTYNASRADCSEFVPVLDLLPVCSAQGSLLQPCHYSLPVARDISREISQTSVLRYFWELN